MSKDTPTYSTDTTLELLRDRADTVIKASRVLTSTHLRTDAAAVERMVERELLNNCHVAETDKFLDTILGVSKPHVDRLYRELVEREEYNPDDAFWPAFPKVQTEEKQYYKPFVRVANAVHRACKQQNLKVQIQSCWIDRNTTAPKSRDEDAPTIRPDILAVLGDADDIKAWDAEIDEKGKRVADGEKRKKIQAEARAMKEAWWLRVHVPVEIKRENSGPGYLSAVRQLCGYMRQVFREQVDRRFVLGLVFCATDLSVWLCDRSGLLGTATSFNIHKEPKKFIQVIAALALSEPDRLGWDLSMKLYRPLAENPFIHSYDPSVRLDDFRKTAYQTHWAITMPSHDDPSTRETFITVHGLSVVHSEVMCGRATLVWEVVKYNASGADRKRYVLKQCWRPKTASRESDFYKQGPQDSNNIGQIYSSEDVQIRETDSNYLDDTDVRIRRGLDTTPISIAVKTHVLGKRDREETLELSQHVQTTSGPIKCFSPSSTAAANPRVLTRLLMETYGWPIKFFKDLLELLCVVRDAIIGHRALYHKGVLHRDVSVGNILICPEDDNGEKTHGRLIDLDYAKSTDKIHDPVPFAARKDWDAPMIEGYRDVKYFLKVNIDEECYSVLYKWSDGDDTKVAAYMRSILAEKKSQLGTIGDRVLTCKDLDISCETGPRPDFSDHHAQEAPRTATLPFASYEILKDLHYSLADTSEVMHDSIHDLESFFWVVVYLCLTRSGPGGSRRDELKLENYGGVANSVEQIVYCLFDSEVATVLVHNRELLFRHHADMQHVIAEQFCPYFDPVKPLVVKWWRILRLAYLSEGPYPPLYDQVLAAIDETIEETENRPPSTPNAATAAEVERRKKDLARAGRFLSGKLSSEPGAEQSGSVNWNMSPGRARSSHDTYMAVKPPPQKTKKIRT